MEFSSDVILRSSFLHERYSEGNSSDYLERNSRSDFVKLQEAVRNAPRFAHQYIDSLIAQSSATSTHITSRNNHDWWNYLDESLACYAGAKSPKSMISSIEQLSQRCIHLPFFEAFLPFLLYFQRELEKVLPQPFYNNFSVLLDAQQTLADDLLQISGFTLYCEYLGEQHSLGTSNKPDFRNWCQSLAMGGWKNLASKYPVLLRLISQRHQYFKNACREMFVRFEKDKPLLTSFFGVKQLQLTSVAFNLSDSHQMGRRVMRLYFRGGLSIIYKPKPLANEVWFYKTLAPILRKAEFPLGDISVFDRGIYGWAEDVNTINNDSKVSAAGMGKILALFYSLNGTDMHLENIISKDSVVYPLDLEALFHGRPDKLPFVKDWRSWHVLSTELISTELGGGADNISGFFGRLSDFIPPYPTYQFSMCEEQGVRLEVQKNEPEITDIASSINDRDPGPTLEAFKEGISFFLANKHLLPLTNVALNGCTSRFIFRPTAFYERLFQRLYQPRFLRDGIAFSLELSYLFTSLNGADDELGNLLGPVIVDEISQIQNGDVPYFSYSIFNKQLLSSEKNKHSNFFADSGFQLLHRKLEEFTSDDLNKQLQLIEASINFHHINFSTENIDQKKSYSKDQQLPKTIGDPRLLLSTCQGIAATLLNRVSFLPGYPARWISHFGDSSGQTLQPIMGSLSFYNGYWGIILFLSVFEFATNQYPEYIDKKLQIKLLSLLKREAHFWQSERFNVRQDFPLGLGLDGIAGEWFVYNQLLLLSPKRWWFMENRLAMQLSLLEIDEILQDRALDVISGTAGFALSLTQMLQNDKICNILKERMEELLKISVVHLLDNALLQKKGRAWHCLGEPKALLGFAHGSAGFITAITAALDEIRILEQRPRDRKGVKGKKIVSYENLVTKWQEILPSVLSYQNAQEIDGSWRDMRSRLKKATPLNQSWCHGLPGMGISRLALLREGDNQVARTDLERIIHLLRKSENQIDSYCCGLSGEIDFLLQYSMEYDQTVVPYVWKKFYPSLHRLSTDRQYTSTLGTARTDLFPGLFQGISGIGYTALRWLLGDLPSLSGLPLHVVNKRTLNNL